MGASQIMQSTTFEGPNPRSMHCQCCGAASLGGLRFEAII